MKLMADPLDWVVVQLDRDGGAVGAEETDADLETGDGAEIPSIGEDRWVPAVVVSTYDPERVTLEELRGGDEIHITDVTDDTITFRRTASARAWNQGEYIFLNMPAYGYALMIRKLEDVENLMAKVIGGMDGIPRYGGDGAPNELAVVPTDPVSMVVTVTAGAALIDNEAARLLVDTDTAALVAPVANDRIDLVQLVLGVEGEYDSVNVKTGVEDPAPEAPVVDDGALALATILLTTATTEIEEEDITDVRQRL